MSQATSGEKTRGSMPDWPAASQLAPYAVLPPWRLTSELQPLFHYFGYWHLALKRAANDETRRSTPGTRRSPETQPSRSRVMMASLTEGVRRCQSAISFHSAASSQTVCRQGGIPSTQMSCGGTSCGIWDAGAIPAASTLSVISRFIGEIGHAQQEREGQSPYSLTGLKLGAIRA
jgi:hypothetical protein